MMVYEPSRTEPQLRKPRAVALEVRSDQDVKIALNGASQVLESAVTVPKGDKSRTIVLPFGDNSAAPDKLAIEATGLAGASIFIDRIALLP